MYKNIYKPSRSKSNKTLKSKKVKKNLENKLKAEVNITR